MAKEFKMSQARYDELKQELDYSKTTRADEVAELIKEAPRGAIHYRVDSIER